MRGEINKKKPAKKHHPPNFPEFKKNPQINAKKKEETNPLLAVPEIPCKFI